MFSGTYPNISICILNDVIDVIDIFWKLNLKSIGLADVLAYQSIAVRSNPEHLIVAVIMKFGNTVTDQFFKLSFVLYFTVDFNFCMKVILSVKCHFIDESSIGNSKTVFSQMAYFPDVRLLVICFIVGDFDGAEVLLF